MASITFQITSVQTSITHNAGTGTASVAAVITVQATDENGNQSIVETVTYDEVSLGLPTNVLTNLDNALTAIKNAAVAAYKAGAGATTLAPGV